MMPFQTNRSRQHQLLSTLTVVLCLLLILFIGATQLLHTHPANEGTNRGCSLCAVAHLSALPVPALSNAVLTRLMLLLQQAAPVHAPPRFRAFSLYVRPPPVLTTLS